MADRDPRKRPSDANEALALVRQTRSMIDEPTLDRRADSPSGPQFVLNSSNATAVLDATPTGQTVTLPIGLGEDFAEGGDEWEGDYPATDDTPTKPRLAWWVGALVAAAVMLVAMGVWWYTGFGPGAYTTVPSVAGQPAAAAQTTLKGAGFLVTMTDAFDDTVPVGLVIATDPAASARIAKGGAVTAKVSQGPLMVQIPKVVGVDIADAKSRIAAALFPAPTIDEEWSDTVPVNEVYASTPDQETMARHNAAITLKVSKGPEPITIPNVVGATLQTAQDTLGFYKLNVNVQHGRTLDVATGQIYKQDPAANAAGFRVQDMTIWVSDGKPFIDVPDFTLKPVDQEVQRAKDLGFNVVLKKLWPFSTKNQISNQDIAPGTANVEWGTTITLTYN
jgi:beta-lactam-binding protein with PASTA domain